MKRPLTFLINSSTEKITNPTKPASVVEVSAEVKARPHPSAWRRYENRELPEQKLSYRAFTYTWQCAGTELPNWCFGYTTWASFESVIASKMMGACYPTTNLIHSILSAQNETINCLISSRKKKGAKRSNYRFEKKEITHEGVMFRFVCNIIPDTVIGLDGCFLQDAIAESLGGVKAAELKDSN
jgi:hypothetical protein